MQEEGCLSLFAFGAHHRLSSVTRFGAQLGAERRQEEPPFRTGVRKCSPHAAPCDAHCALCVRMAWCAAHCGLVEYRQKRARSIPSFAQCVCVCVCVTQGPATRVQKFCRAT